MNDSRRIAARSLWWVGLESAGVSGLSLVTIVLLARLLAPADFGVAALALGLVQLFGVVVEMLFHDAIVQRPQLDDDHVDTAFWTSLGLSVVLALGCVAGSGGIAALYGEPALAPLLRWAALGLVFTGMTAVPIAVMRRRLQFRTLTMRTIAGRLLGVAVGIGIALLGYGPWAIVGQYLVANFVAMLVIWAQTARLPACRYSPAHGRQLLGFALPSLSGHLLFTGNLRVFTLLAGYLLGATAVGYVNLAFRVFDVLRDVLSAAVNSLALSLLSRRHGDAAALVRAYQVGTAFTCLVALPICAGILACAREVVLTVFGVPWLPAVPLLQVLAVAAMVNFVRQMTPITLNAVGRPQDNLVATLVGLAVSLAALSILGPLGAFGAALAWGLRSLALLPVGVVQLRRAVGLGVATQFAGAAVPLAAALAMVAGLQVARQEVTAGWPPAAALALLVPLGLAVDVVVVGLLNRRSLVDLAGFLLEGQRRSGRPVGEGSC
jgi:O-antigen/teichoic acid export membrane protein